MRLAAGLHRDFIRIALDNALVEAGALELLGTPIDLGRVTVDNYVVAGIADHITPWEKCRRTTRMLGGDTRFALSTSGHIAAIVNPPRKREGELRVAEEGEHEDPECGSRRPRSGGAPGGRTGTAGSRTARDRCARPEGVGGPGYRRKGKALAPMCWRTDGRWLRRPVENPTTTAWSHQDLPTLSLHHAAQLSHLQPHVASATTPLGCSGRRATGPGHRVGTTTSNVPPLSRSV